MAALLFQLTSQTAPVQLPSLRSILVKSAPIPYTRGCNNANPERGSPTSRRAGQADEAWPVQRCHWRRKIGANGGRLRSSSAALGQRCGGRTLESTSSNSAERVPLVSVAVARRRCSRQYLVRREYRVSRQVES